MNVKVLAQDTGLTVKAVRYLEQMGVISDPMTDDAMFFMHTLATVWGREEFIRLQIANMSMARRVRLLFGAGYGKPERYMIHRLLAHYADKRDGAPFTLHISQLVDEVMCYYHLPQSARQEVTATAYRLRRRVCNMRYRNPDLVEIAKALTTTRTPKPAKRTTPSRKFNQNDIFGY